jgi:hypothetical protein
MSLAGEGLLPRLDTGFAGFLDRLNDNPPVPEDAYLARNAVLDERISHRRAKSYAASGGAADHADLRAWKDAHETYLLRHVAPPAKPGGSLVGLDLAETFSDPSNAVPLAPSVRLVRLSRFPSRRDIPIGYSAFVSALERTVSHQTPSPDDIRTVTAGLQQWESTDYGVRRPRWCTRWTEVRELFGETVDQDDPTWPDVLRDRCGLWFYGGTKSAPIPVLLLRYEVVKVKAVAAPGQATPVAVPSMLDSPLFEPFCPAPSEATSGYAVNLATIGDLPNAEYVHAPFRLTSSDVFRIGAVTTSAGDLSTAREDHLRLVRQVCRRPDYGIGTETP